MNLEEQFQKSRRKIQLLRGTVTGVDIIPNEQVKDVPLLLVSGWGETLDTTKSIVLSLARTGRRVLALESHHLDTIVKNSEQFPQQGYVKALVLLEFLNTQKIEKVDVIAHSQGAINAVIAAWVKPNVFNTLILVGPAGMLNKDEFLNLAGRFSSHLFYHFLFHSGQKINFSIQYIIQVFIYIFSNPLQALQEAVGMVNFHIAQMVRSLQKNNMKIHVVHDEDDVVFPFNEVKKTVHELGIENFHSMKGWHNFIHEQPEKSAQFFATILNT